MALKDLIPWRKRKREEEEWLLPIERDRELFRDFFADLFRPWALMRMRPFDEVFRGRFYPDIDVTETDKEYRVTAELPGLSKDDIDVSLEEGVLTIRGEKRQEERHEKEDYVCVERSYGSFVRRIPLPSEVDESRVEARFKNGVLRLTLPKSEEHRGRKIEIASG